MSETTNHLNHSTWECKYHVVFTPKYRKRCERPTGRSVIDDYDSWKFHGINSSIWLCG